MRGILFLSAILLAAFLSVSSAEVLAGGGQPGSIVGGWRPIHNLTDEHVQKIARFAVAEHNREEYATLILRRVVSGETQVVSGTNYRLVIVASAAAAGGGDGKYEAVVWEKLRGNLELTSFKLLG